MGSMLDHITKADISKVRIIMPKDEKKMRIIAASVEEAIKKRVEARKYLQEANAQLNKFVF